MVLYWATKPHPLSEHFNIASASPILSSLQCFLSFFLHTSKSSASPFSSTIIALMLRLRLSRFCVSCHECHIPWHLSTPHNSTLTSAACLPPSGLHTKRSLGLRQCPILAAIATSTKYPFSAPHLPTLSTQYVFFSLVQIPQYYSQTSNHKSIVTPSKGSMTHYHTKNG